MAPKITNCILNLPQLSFTIMMWGYTFAVSAASVGWELRVNSALLCRKGCVTMFEKITPEKAGISSAQVEAFIRRLDRRGLATHSVLLMRGDKIFGEFYWKPFHKDLCHRMYSETKSFVSVAIGLLIDDGKLSLDDRIACFFPDKYSRELPNYLKEMTVRQMLMMETCGYVPNWFENDEEDRVRLYMSENTSSVPAGMRFSYDSAGSQVLSTLVEQLSGKSLFDFLYDRVFIKLGTFKTATILKTKTEDSFGDSALLCTTRDMASFGRFVMNYGKWNAEQLISESYLRAATSPLTDSDELGFDDIDTRGYGYQIWCLGNGRFFFNGMGCQLTFCIPDKDLIFVITSDNQGYPAAKSLIYAAFEDLILDEIQSESLPEDPAAYASLCACSEMLHLMTLKGEKTSPAAKDISGRRYVCEDNTAGIREFTFTFAEDNTGVLCYVNEQGEKKLSFGLGRNVYGKFPQLGYSNEHAGLRTDDGFMYDCAVCAVWREKQKLLMKVQIIDRYLGNMLAMFSFRDNFAVVRMTKTAEDFLNEYVGEFVARREASPCV